MTRKEMVVRLCGVQIYRGNFAPISVSVSDHNGEEELFNFNPNAVQVKGEDLVKMIEEMSRNGALRIHPNSVQEF